MSAFGGKADIANMPRRPLKTKAVRSCPGAFLMPTRSISVCATREVECRVQGTENGTG